MTSPPPTSPDHTFAPDQVPSTLLEETGGPDHDGHTITRTYQIVPEPGQPLLIRVSIRRDLYPDQSHAHADVLTPALTWTRVTELHPTSWHRPTNPRPNPGTRHLALTELADQLLARAALLLHRAAQPLEETARARIGEANLTAQLQALCELLADFDNNGVPWQRLSTSNDALARSLDWDPQTFYDLIKATVHHSRHLPGHPDIPREQWGAKALEAIRTAGR